MLSHVLSFPAYLPTAREVRASLLLYDRMSTMVPKVDQKEVLDRDEISGIYGHIPPDALTFFDPDYEYVDWFNNDKTKSLVKRKSRSIIRGDGYKNISEWFTVDQSGYFKPAGDFDLTYDRLIKEGWRPLALQKFPPDLLQTLLELRLAAKIPAFKSEQEPVLTHPTIGGFVLGQIARHFASDGVCPLANSDNSFKDCLFDGSLTVPEQRSVLLGITINVAVPSDVESVNGDDFASLRSALSKQRLDLNKLLQDLLVKMNLDGEHDAVILKQRISDRAADIHRAITDAEKNIGPRTLVNQTLTFAVSVLGGAAGFAVGALPGALIGAITPPIMSNVPSRVSTHFYPRGQESFEAFAAIRAKVTRAGERARYNKFVPYL